MIEIDDIKVGLEFKLPFREDEYDEETARNRHRKIMGEYGCVLPTYRTDLKTIEGVKLFITPYRPIFKVVDFPRDCYKTDLEHHHYVGSFIEVTCKGNTFRLSTEDVIGRGEILEKFDPKKITYFSTSPSEEEWAYNFILGNTRRISKKENFTNNKPSSNAVSDFLNRPTDASAVFRDITNNMFDTYKSKNKDYGDSFHKLFKECGMTYAYGHMAEKLERINSLRKNEAKVKGESMKDSLYDLANYAILTIMELEKTEK
nr:MAG TPA: Nucleotide modification associated domain 1 [Caudoviricetes sp.]